jgi:hypothetical protein
MFNVVYWFENTVVLKYPIMIIILELIVSFTAGMIFFYLIENPMMNIGILIIKCLPEESNGNIFQNNSTYSTKHLISVIKILFIFLFYFFFVLLFQVLAFLLQSRNILDGTNLTAKVLNKHLAKVFLKFYHHLRVFFLILSFLN